jgi:phosphoglycolate phosphatase-like HAD superfamily hydrolase
MDQPPMTVLCWDIDGTLLSTARAGVFALEEAAREVCGAEVDLQRLKTAGLTDSEIAALVIDRFGGDGDLPARVSAFLRAYERHLPERLHWRRGHVMPGVVEALDHLAARPDVLNILLTGNTPAGGRAKLEHYGLTGYFDDGAFCADGDDRPTIARRARALAEHLAGAPLPPERLVVIGDTPADVRCGQSIGARTVAVATGGYTREELETTRPFCAWERLPAPDRLAASLGLAAAPS